MASPPMLQVETLDIGVGGRVLQRDLSFDVVAGEVLVIVGPSGCGKSTLLRHLVGLERPARGHVRLGGHDLHRGGDEQRAVLRRRFGVMFQSGALWSSLSVGDNLMLPMRMFTPWGKAECHDRARAKLDLVGLGEAMALMPSQLSGGMRKRAALARALALDPELLFLDEPGSGLDPLNAARLDELVLRLREVQRTTVVMVTHEIASALAVGDRALYLDDQPDVPAVLGTPRALMDGGPDAVRRFFHRGADSARLTATASAPGGGADPGPAGRPG